MYDTAMMNHTEHDGSLDSSTRTLPGHDRHQREETPTPRAERENMCLLATRPGDGGAPTQPDIYLVKQHQEEHHYSVHLSEGPLRPPSHHAEERPLAYTSPRVDILGHWRRRPGR